MDLPSGPERPDSISYGPLPGYLGYLLRRAQAQVFVDFAASMGEHRVTPGEFGLLAMVAANPGITPARLAAAVGLDKSTLSPALQRLADRGLLRRETLSEDRRFQALFLSPEGCDAYARMTPTIAAHEARIADALTAEEQAVLMRLLRRMIGL
jgi:DNA-binding MarR family transcriptional regulator